MVRCLSEAAEQARTLDTRTRECDLPLDKKEVAHTMRRAGRVLTTRTAW